MNAHFLRGWLCSGTAHKSLLRSGWQNLSGSEPPVFPVFMHTRVIHVKDVYCMKPKLTYFNWIYLSVPDTGVVMNGLECRSHETAAP